MKLPRSIGSLALFFSGLALPLLAQTPDPLSSTAEAQHIQVPEGTVVELRFAQALWGMKAGYRVRPNHVQPGEEIRLVIAQDVVIDGKVVLRKGNPAQATVQEVWEPSVDMHGIQEFCTCIALQFDWIKSINNQEIPIRAYEKPNLKAKEKGKVSAFSLVVDSTSAGAVAKSVPFGFDMLKPENFTKGLAGSMTGYTAIKSIHRKDWVPPGTRMTAFVDETVLLDTAAVDAAQELLPTPNENALVMIYRLKGKKDQQAQITCDSKDAGELGAKQFLTLELAPGKHTCQADSKFPFEISVSGGQEYYLAVKADRLDGRWHLTLVSNAEGEDGVGAGESADSDDSDSETE
jgi:hypothetical protein